MEDSLYTELKCHILHTLSICLAPYLASLREYQRVQVLTGVMLTSIKHFIVPNKPKIWIPITVSLVHVPY